VLALPPAAEASGAAPDTHGVRPVGREIPFASAAAPG
jgi:hypothetical protein